MQSAPSTLQKLASPPRLLARKLGFCCACVLLLWQPSVWAVECKLWQGDSHVLEGKTIGAITIDANDIFNNNLPEENRWIHRLGNKLHYQTRRETVARQLLFAEGDAFSQRVLDESERLLRSKPYLAEANIRVLQVCADEVWIRVRTADTWSTIPEISLSRVAGENQRKISLEENNLAGLGQELAFSYDNELGRVSRALKYKHHDWAGRRQLLDLELQNNEDGERYELTLSRPYLSLTDTYSWSLSGFFDKQAIELYQDGEISETMGLEQRYIDVYRSFSDGLVQGQNDRWTFGLRIDERSYYRVNDTVSDANFSDRRDRYPYLRLDHIKENYVEMQHIQQLSGIEDINLGTQYGLELGYGARAWGSDDDALIINFSHERGRRWKERSLLLSNSWAETQLTHSKLQQLRIGAMGQLHTRISEQDQFFVELMFDSTHRAREDFQLAIGGDSGLRGYPYKAQTGNRLLRMSSELRHYPNWNPWQLLRFGAAFFADYGAAWDAGGESPEWLWDLGVGLRLGSSRSSSGRVLHLDFALPEGKGSPQWTATAKTHF